MKKITLKKSYTREKSMSYMFMWNQSELLGYKKFLGSEMQYLVLKSDPSTKKTSVWHNPQELVALNKKIFDSVVNNPDFSNSIQRTLDEEWIVIYPYLSDKKVISSIEEFYNYYESLNLWWSALNTVYPILNNPHVSEEQSKKFFQHRNNSEKFTSKMDKIMIGFWNSKIKENTDLIWYCSAYELKNLYEKSLNLESVKKRKNGFYIHNLNFYTSNELLDKYEFFEESEDNINFLKGNVACRGSDNFYRAKVKVINSSDELSKIEEGEFLVASMTTPDYLPAMKKATGFITDEGGITCHAAIVSREMNKPCIIGTKNATKILKDGDLIEVDANKGVVRKIE